MISTLEENDEKTHIKGECLIIKDDVFHSQKAIRNKNSRDDGN